MDIRFFLRKKYPGYFSIEQLFVAICNTVRVRLPQNDSADIIEVPYYFSPLNFLRNIFFLRARQCNVNHITGDIHYAILGCSRENLNVLTIHDCVLLEKYSKWNPKYWVFRILWYELPMRKADLITVISEKTKTDLITKIGYGEQKIRVVGNFVNDAFVYQPTIFNKANPRLLFIGSTDNKNLDRILQAITGLTCNLQIVGKISAAQQLFIDNNNIQTHLSFELTLPELADQYSKADIVLFPSLYEGFGMLIIEANATGRPVITSNISPMKEVAGEAACFVDPYSVSAIREGIIKVIEDDVFRAMLVAKGLKNAALYRPERVADTYIQLYKEFSQKLGHAAL
ncbi:MAG: glycosyltransferase family 1 protein [Chitinophagaceae bacterium]